MTRTCSSWICAWTLSLLSLIAAMISLPFSLEMPAWMIATCRTLPPKAGSSLLYSSESSEMPRLISLFWRMSLNASSLPSSLHQR